MLKKRHWYAQPSVIGCIYALLFKVENHDDEMHTKALKRRFMASAVAWLNMRWYGSEIRLTVVTTTPLFARADKKPTKTF